MGYGPGVAGWYDGTETIPRIWSGSAIHRDNVIVHKYIIIERDYHSDSTFKYTQLTIKILDGNPWTSYQELLTHPDFKGVV